MGIIGSRRMRSADRGPRFEEKGTAYRLLVRKPERKIPLGRPRLRWLNNIKKDLVDIVWDGVDWIGLVRDKGKCPVLVNVERTFGIHIAGKLPSDCTICGFLSSAQLHRVS
jgi:hypothetical protein